jgi:hypothetical protein
MNGQVAEEELRSAFTLLPKQLQFPFEPCFLDRHVSTDAAQRTARKPRRISARDECPDAEAAGFTRLLGCSGYPQTTHGFHFPAHRLMTQMDESRRTDGMQHVYHGLPLRRVRR